MSILARIGRIARANINWLLDKAEPPEQELQAKINELTEAIQECKAAAGTYGATFRRLEAEAKSLQARQAELLQQAELAVRSGDDDTARKRLAENVSVANKQLIAVATPDGRVGICSGECPGVITLKPGGTEGFGYDPIFYLPELGKTMAELSPEAKNRVSHRGQAAKGVPAVLAGLGL